MTDLYLGEVWEDEVEVAEEGAPEEEVSFPLRLTILAPQLPNEKHLLRYAACKGDDRFTDTAVYSTRRRAPDGRRAREWPPTVRDELVAICDGCPAFTACRELVDHIEEGISPNRWHGMWAGEIPEERKQRRGRGLHPRRARRLASSESD